MKRIELSKGKFAKVDDEDYEVLNRWKWSVLSSGTSKKIYAARHGGILMHREILGLKKGEICDHKDMDGLNNQKTNLRKCTINQNNANVTARGGRKYKGVYHDNRGKLSKPWKAQITVGGKVIWLGLFEKEEEAARAYNNAAHKYFSSFARLNKI